MKYETMKRKIGTVLELFARITTCIMIVAAIYITIFWGLNNMLNVGTLWQIIIVGAICSLGTLFFSCDDSRISKRSMLLRLSIKFLYVNGIVLAAGVLFHWVDPSNWRMIVVMELCIIGAYCLVTAAGYLTGYKTAERMNQKLQERNRDESE